MQRQLPLALALLGAVMSPSPRAAGQDPVAAAAREEAADNYRSVSAKVTRLEEELNSYQTRMVRLIDEIHKLRQEVDTLKNRNENAATLEKINRLQEAIKQVDEARQEDNKRVLAKIDSVRTDVMKALKGLATAPPPAPAPVDEPRREPPPKTASSPGPKSPPEDSYLYTIKKGDTLSGIVTALRAQGYKVSPRQIEEANPGVNWSRLSIGKKVIIPPPTPSP